MTFLTQSQFAKRCGVQRQTVSRWAKKGWLKLSRDGRIDAEASEAKLATRPAKYRGGTVGGPRSADASATLTLSQAQARKELAQAELAELRLQRERGEFLSSGEVRQTWGRIMIAVRQTALSWPAKFRFELPHLTSANAERIETIIRDDLTDLSMGRGFFSAPRQEEDDEDGN
jgi:phage terminase Nu1 subunit (DNA packaging protein)